MGKPPSTTTPQFRTALIRKLKNIEPEYEVEFFKTDNGIAFRLLDKSGRYRSKIINIGSRVSDGLEKSYLERQLRFAGFPKIFGN